MDSKEHWDKLLTAGILLVAGLYARSSAQKVKAEAEKIEGSAAKVGAVVDQLNEAVRQAVAGIDEKILQLNSTIDEVKSGVEANAEQLEGVKAEISEIEDIPMNINGDISPSQKMRGEWEIIREKILIYAQAHQNGNTRRKYRKIGKAYVTLMNSMALDAWVTMYAAGLVEDLQQQYRKTMHPHQRQAYDSDPARQQKWAETVEAFNKEAARW